MKAKNILSKLKSEAGESLGEVLIALLIAALALTMLASVITTASSIINRSKTAMDRYYAATNGLNSGEKVELANGEKIVNEESWDDKKITITIKDDDSHYEIKPKFSNVKAYSIVESIASGVKVIAYKK